MSIWSCVKIVPTINFLLLGIFFFFKFMLKLGFQNQFMLWVLQSFVLAKTKLQVSQIHIKICYRNSF